MEEWLKDQASDEILEQQKELKKKQKIAYILEDIEDLIEESNDGAVRVRDIVQNLKSFSRVDQTEFTQADINECLESSIAMTSLLPAAVESGFFKYFSQCSTGY